MNGMDPAKMLELNEEIGQQCYDCLHSNKRTSCEKMIRGYPKEGKSTCIHFIYQNPEKRADQLCHEDYPPILTEDRRT